MGGLTASLLLDAVRTTPKDLKSDDGTAIQPPPPVPGSNAIEVLLQGRPQLTVNTTDGKECQ